MWAVQYHRHGSPDVLTVDEVPIPRLRSGQVLVGTVASGVSRIDAKFRRGRLPHGLRFPKQTGFDAVGVVADAGDTALPVGQPVAVVLGLEPLRARGTTVDLLAVEPERCGLFPPEHHLVAGDVAPVLGGLTALRAIRDVVRPRPGDRLLVVGGGGPVGLAAIRLAGLFGARVDAVVGQAALTAAHGMGADLVVDHRSQDCTALQQGRRYDGIVLAAGEPASWCGAGVPGARMALTDGSAWPRSLMAARRTGMASRPVAAGHDSRDLTWLAHRIADGELPGVVGATFAPHQAVEAHRALNTPGTCGARVIDHLLQPSSVSA